MDLARKLLLDYLMSINSLDCPNCGESLPIRNIVTREELYDEDDVFECLNCGRELKLVSSGSDFELEVND